MRILVATDLTARSDRALIRSFLIARQLSAELRILHVVDVGLPEEIKIHSAEWAKQALAREMERLTSSTGCTAAFDVIVGNPVQDIVRATERYNADLLVLGVHPGVGAGSRSFGETTAGRILKSSLTAALLVKGEAIHPYKKAVIGADFSAFCRAAIRQTARIAPGARMCFVHAYHVPFKSRLGSVSFVQEFAQAEQLELDAFVKNELDILVSCARNIGVEEPGIEKIVQEGRPEQVLRNVRDRVEADLIVIATHGRGMISRAIWGSVAVDLLSDPPCDILVIKPF